jgi:hypothetical protein
MQIARRLGERLRVGPLGMFARGFFSLVLGGMSLVGRVPSPTETRSIHQRVNAVRQFLAEGHPLSFQVAPGSVASDPFDMAQWVNWGNWGNWNNWANWNNWSNWANWRNY